VEFLAALEEAGAERDGPVRKRTPVLDLAAPTLRLPGPPISVPPAFRQH
jgi:hypothetical protein